MEILELIINLSIALIAVDISIYAISVSLLGSQLKANELYIKRRLEETEDEIKEIQKAKSSSSERLSGMEEKIKEFKKEEKELTDILYFLSLRGAVLLPIVPFVGTLLLGAYGIVFPSQTHLIALVSPFFFLYGGYRLYSTLRSIDFASTNIPLPFFDVVFDINAKQRLEIEATTKQNVRIAVGNIGYDVAEMVEVAMFFPPSFKVHKSREYAMNIQPKTGCEHPSFTGVFLDVDILHVDTSVVVDITITSPSDTGSYKLPLYVNERKKTQEEFELKLVVK